MVDPEFAPLSEVIPRKVFLRLDLLLIFYHIGILCVSVCGNFICAVSLCVSIIAYSSLFIENVIKVFANIILLLITKLNCLKTK